MCRLPVDGSPRGKVYERRDQRPPLLAASRIAVRHVWPREKRGAHIDGWPSLDLSGLESN